jgi:hypothetical protein
MSTSKFNNMQDYDEFQQIGKEIPFEVPAGFFESFAEKTLKKAISREHIHKKNNLLRLIFSVAASVALLFYLGLHFKQNPAPIPVPNLIAERTKPTNQSVNKLSRETLNPKNIVELNKVIPEKINEKELTTQEKTEVLRDILSDLSDDDLQQMAIRYKTDAFINESLQ